jgi:hypothetical protein
MTLPIVIVSPKGVPARRSAPSKHLATIRVLARRRGHPVFLDSGACSEQSEESPGLLRLCLATAALLAMTNHLLRLYEFGVWSPLLVVSELLTPNSEL